MNVEDYFTDLTDDCLKRDVHRKDIFSLKTNLAELGGPGVTFLSESLLNFSMKMANKRIIEMIMYENQYVFRTPESIRKVMLKDWQVMEAFIQLGKQDIRCDLRWLICHLFGLGELLPLKDILSRAPPLIIKVTPRQMNTILPGRVIEFEVRTIAKAEINWWRRDSDSTGPIGEPIRMDSCSIKTVFYQTKIDDHGWFFIVITSLGRYHKTSENIYVGNTDTEAYGIAYAENNDRTESIKRVALLVGIMDYSSCHPLSAPKDDIAELDPILREIGYTVYSFADLNMKQFIHVLNTFAKNVIQKDTYVFFYFAGHGCSENQKDFVLLAGNNEKMQITDILNILLENEPKPILTIFDTCRNDLTNKNQSECKMVEANLPIRDGMMLVMSTFPKEKAYEKQKRYESHSQIIKPLRNCLLKNACKMHINKAFAEFVNDPSITDQRPAVYAGPMPYILGRKDFCIPIFRPKIKWLDGEIALDFKFDGFHNMLHIWLEQASKDYFKSEDFKYEYESRFVKEIKINLFDIKQSFNDDRSLNLKIHRFEHGNVNGRSLEVAFQIIFPEQIASFLLN